MEVDDSIHDDRDDEQPNSSDEEGIDVMNSDDSSEEEEEDPEEEAKIREGFIVDEDEDSRERRRRKKKKRKQREREFEALSDDDLDLVEQNTGVRIDRPEAKRIKKLKRAGAVESSEDEDEDRLPDIANIFDDISARQDKGKGRRRAEDDTNLSSKAYRAMDDMDEDDMADFIEEDSPDEEEGETRHRDAAKERRAAQKERRRRRGGFSLSGMDISNEAWDEIQEVFGDGHDYDDALESDDEESKPVPTIRDVFEPSEIAERMMTDADDIIRALDIPERMQIAQTGIESKRIASEDGQEENQDVLLQPDQIQDAALWVSTRISEELKEEFVVRKDGSEPPLRMPFLTAVARVLQFLCIDYFEVPFIWVHRRDYFIHHNPEAFNASERSKPLLSREDLWKIYSLAIKYRALLDRKAHLAKLWSKLQIQDPYFDALYQNIESLEEASDLVEYISQKYQKKLKEMAEDAGATLIPEDAEADATRNGLGGTKYKRATSSSRYEKAKASLVSRFAERIAMSAESLAQDFITGIKQHYMDDPHTGPDSYASEYADASSGFSDSTNVLLGARVILTSEIAKEPSIRKEIRKAFKSFGAVSVKPTANGNLKIDEMHPFYAFKYLSDKPVEAFRNSPQFLQILEAENEGLVSIDIHILKDPLHKLTQEFYNVYLSDLTSDDARAWNKVREEIIRDTLQSFLLPLGARWTRDWLKDETEEYIAARCAAKLEQRVDMAPYQPRGKKKGDCPRVLALSHGQGNFKKDFVYAVCLNQRGRLIDHERFEDIRFADTKVRLKEHIERLKPDVIVIGGFTPTTHRLHADVKIVRDLIKSERTEAAEGNSNLDQDQLQSQLDKAEIDIIYVQDDVARTYLHSKRAMTDFGEISPVARYCIGLARYAQSPLCEYAALGSELSAISFDAYQKLVPRDKLQPVLESALVNVVNIVGVDINRAIRDAYYRVLLPYVAGLGPRKANGMVKRINAAGGGTLVCRADLIKLDVCTARIFMNCVAFLKIPPEEHEEEADYDILDSTRIHSEDYHIARKMAADAEELDEEDLDDMPHPSGAVVQLMERDPHKLDELSLDDFAAALFETQGLQKRLTLYMIRDELQNPYSERRQDFKSPTENEIFTMLTGETRQTLDLGFIIPVVVLKVLPKGGVICRLDSGIEGYVGPGYMEQDVQYQVGQTVQGQVIGLKPAEMAVELSLLSQSIQTDDSERRKVQPDRYYDTIQMSMDKQANEARNKKIQGRQRRVVNHPNFQNMNAGQAEQYLANQQRGDCVIRTSSRGNDHLAVTWKVDEGVYQHIDVLELDKPNEFSLGRSLRIQGKYTYSDLDELIHSHVRAMARKVDEMMHSDKYKGSEADLRKWLQTSIMAEPTRSFYGFALDLRKPGNFILSFLTKGYEIQSWGVTVEPDAFVLQGNNDPAPNVTMLCNAFKSTYITKMALGGGGAAGLAARTPYISGRTPNPYGGGMTPYQAARSPYGGPRPTQPLPPRSPYGAGRPGPPPAQASGAYIHPSRLAQQQQGYANGGR